MCELLDGYNFLIFQDMLFCRRNLKRSDSLSGTQLRDAYFIQIVSILTVIYNIPNYKLYIYQFLPWQL